jgi:RHS repeat-associated protein
MARGPQHGATTFVGVLLLVGLGVPVLAVGAPTSAPTTLTACTPGAPVAAVADSFIAVPLGSSAGEVWTYDSTSGVPLGSPITVGYDPVAMAVDTEYSELFVLNQGITGDPATVSVINYSTGFAVGATISLPTGDVPDAIIVSPGGNHVVVADTNQHALTVINPVSPYTIANLPLLPSSTVPSTLAFSDNADYLYVGDTVNSRIDELTYSANSPWYTYTTDYTGYVPTIMVTPSSSTYNTLFVGDDSDDEVHVFTIATNGPLTLNSPWAALAQPPVGLADPGTGTELYVSFGGTMSGSGNTTHDQFDEIATGTGNIVPETTPHQDSIGALAVNGDSTIVAMASTATGGQNVDRWAVVQNQSQDAVDSLGGVPSAIISVPAQSLRFYAYVAQSAEINSNESGDVSVVDLLSDNDIEDLPVGVDPQALAVSPDGSKVYVANAGVPGYNGSLSLITTADIGTAINPVSTVTVPGIVFGPNTRLDAAVLSPSGDQLLLADYGTGAVYDVELGTSTDTSTTIGASRQPLAIAMSPSGNYAYVINSNDASITVLKTSGQNQPYTFDQTESGLSLSSPQGEAISPNGRTLYVSDTNGTSGILRAYSIGASNGLLTADGTAPLASGAPGAVAVSPQGGTVYVALSATQTAVVNAATLAVTYVAAGDDSSQTVATTPDGGKFVVADSGYCGDTAGSLAVFNTGQTTPTEVNFPPALGNSDPSAIAMSAGFVSPVPVQLATRGELGGGGVNPAEVATTTAMNDVRAGVDTATGSYSLSLPGLSVASPGLPLGFSASYDSANAVTTSAIGDGWTFPYAMSIATPASGNGCQYVVTQENSSVADFADVVKPTMGCSDTTISDFGPPARVAATMTRPSSTSWQGTSACPPGTGNCLIFQRQAGTEYFFSTAVSAPYPLVGMQDIYGNTITLSYGGTGTCGSGYLASATAQANGTSSSRKLQFAWSCPDPNSGQDQISSITDPLGREISFAYNSSGELGQYTLSGGGDRLANHQFEFAYAPTGKQLVNWWDPDAVVLGGSTYPTLPALIASTTIAYATYTSANYAVCPTPLTVSAVTSVTEPQVMDQGTVGTADYTPETMLDYDQYDFCSGDGAVTVADPDWTAFANAQGGNITLDDYADLALLSSDSGYGPNDLGSVDDSPSGRDGLPDAANAITIYIRDPATLAAREVVDPDGNDTSTEYNALGDTVSVTKPDSGVTTMLYNPDNELTESTTNVAGALRTISYTYNRPYLTAITNPTGNVTNYLQAADGETCEILRPVSAGKGNVLPSSCGTMGGNPGLTTTTFDSYGDTGATTDPDGDVTSYAYDQDGEVCGMLSADGYVADGNTPLGSCPPATGGSYVTAYPFYDDYGDLLQKTTPKTSGSAGNVWLTYYDADGQEVAAMTPSDTSCNGNTAGNCEYATYDSYDPDGSLVSVANDEQGTGGPNTTTYTYNPDGSRVSTVSPDGNATGNNPNNYRTIYTYDDLDRLIATTDPLGGSSCNPETTQLCAYTTYQANDADGRVLTSITAPTSASANGIETVTTYDGDGDVVETETETADYTASTTTVISKSTSTYDDADEILTSVQPDGYMSGQTAANWTTSYVYDADGRVSSVTAPAGEGNTSGAGSGAGTTWDFYDADGNEVAVTNGDGNGSTCNAATTLTCASTTYYAYDIADRLQTVTAAAGQSSSTATGYTYDADGNPHVVTNPSSVTTTYGYDSADEVTGVSYSDGTPTVSYTYNIDGTRSSMSGSGAGAYDYVYSYDLAQRLTGVTNGSATVAGYGYDNSSNVTSLTYPSGLVVTDAYDHDSELQSASWGTSKRVSFSYDQAGELTTTTAQAGSTNPTLTTTTSYDGGGRITELSTQSTAQGSPLLVDNYDSSYDITIDPNGNPTGEAVTTGTTAQPTNYYAYDYVDRANYDSTNGPSGEPVGASSQTYTYDKANYVTQGSAVAVSQFYGDGEIETATTTGGGHTSVPFSYDPGQNRIGESISGTTTSYAFSAAGVMCWSAPTASIPTGGTTPSCSSPPTGATTYTYDGDGLRNTKTTSSGTTTFSWDSESGVPRLLEDGQNDYIYGPSGTPVAQVALSGGAVDFLLSDREGSVRMVASAASGLSLGYTGYDAYGNPTTSGGLTSLTPVGFQGGYTDATGLVYFEQRYYDPGTGQFMSLDPLNQMTNAGYSFVKDNPFGGTDPSGEIRLPPPDYVGNVCASGQLPAFAYTMTCLQQNPCGQSFLCMAKVAVSVVLAAGSAPSPEDLLGLALSARDLVSAGVSAVRDAVEGSGAGEGLSSVEQQTFDDIANNPNNLDHVFVERHNFGDLINQFGSQQNVLRQMILSLRSASLPETGVFDTVVDVGGTSVEVNGAVVNGVPRIGSAWVVK